jgi:hypothetical protein
MAALRGFVHGGNWRTGVYGVGAAFIAVVPDSSAAITSNQKIFQGAEAKCRWQLATLKIFRNQQVVDAFRPYCIARYSDVGVFAAAADSNQESRQEPADYAVLLAVVVRQRS